MASSLPCLLLLVLTLLAASAPSTAAAPLAALEKVVHLHFYWHEIQQGPNTTTVAVATPPGGSSVSFGYVGLFDDLIKEGPEPSSRLLGRAQGLVTTPTTDGSSILTAFQIVFTAGEYAGSSLAVFGKALDGDVYDRAIIGGTGRFRMARGYTLSKMLDTTVPGLLLLEYHAYILLNDVAMPPSPFAAS